MPVAGSWPATDYDDAVQNPRANFADRDLQSGSVRQNMLGLPLGISGKTAVVYSVDSHGHTIAVRCFTTQVTDQEQRYAALTQHLSGLWLPSLVHFGYQ